MKKLLFTLFLLVFIIQGSFGQDGSFDSSFAVNGVNQFSLGSKNTRGNSIIYLSDSSIVIAGNSDTSHAGALLARSFYLAKFHSNGTIDVSFGTNGTIFIPNGNNGDSYFFSMIKQPDDKILVAGTIDGSPVLIRMLPNGTYDISFGNNGIVSFNYGYKLGLQSTGKIIASGQYYNGVTNIYSFSRFESNGSLDSTFGINGTAQTDVTPFVFDLIHSILIQPDDKIIAVGTSYDNQALRNAVIARFDINGNLDNSFAGNGVSITPIGPSPGHAVFYDVGILPNGKIVACGDHEYAVGTGGFGGIKPAIVRYNSNGSLDSTFGNNGIVIINTIFNANDHVNALKLQSDDKILVGGGASYPFPAMQTYFYIFRLKTDGSLDLNFGNNGNVLTNFANSEMNYVYGFEIQQDGKILAVGLTMNALSQNIDAVLCRFNNQNLLGIEDFISEGHAFIYPNPTSGRFVIAFTNFINEGELEIYNVLGKKEFSVTIHGELETEINLENTSPGIYFVKVFDGEKSFCEKVIIQ